MSLKSSSWRAGATGGHSGDGRKTSGSVFFAMPSKTAIVPGKTAANTSSLLCTSSAAATCHG